MRKVLLLLLACTPFLGACTPAQIAAVKKVVLRHELATCRLTQKYCTTETDTDGTKSVYGSNHCEEDMPCFNCHTMGNGVCGPVWIDFAGKVVHARNGTFPYTSVISTFDEGTDHFKACVEGHRPIAPHDLTALACGQVHDP